MPPSKISVEISDKVPVDGQGLNETLTVLVQEAEDCQDLQEILETVILRFYKSLPGGEKNYSGNPKENLKVGHISLRRDSYGSTPGIISLEFKPSEYYQKKMFWTQYELCKINLRKKTYSAGASSRYSKNYPVLALLQKDTEKVMSMLNLKRVKASKSP